MKATESDEKSNNGLMKSQTICTFLISSFPPARPMIAWQSNFSLIVCALLNQKKHSAIELRLNFSPRSQTTAVPENGQIMAFINILLSKKPVRLWQVAQQTLVHIF
jgi:hypothetical protein